MRKDILSAIDEMIANMHSMSDSELLQDFELSKDSFFTHAIMDLIEFDDHASQLLGQCYSLLARDSSPFIPLIFKNIDVNRLVADLDEISLHWRDIKAANDETYLLAA